jgi:hypothetical protein
MDPNLLPQELRDNELQERKKAVKAPKVFDIYLTDPEKEKNKFDFSGSDKPRISLREKLFGKKAVRAIPSPQLTNPLPIKNEVLKKRPVSDNLLKGSTPAIVRMKPKRSGFSFWKSLLGEPVFPMSAPASGYTKAKENIKADSLRPVQGSQTINQALVKNRPATEFKPEPEKPMPRPVRYSKPIKGDNWWAILGGLFKRTKKVKPEVSLTDESSVKEAPLEKVKEYKFERPKVELLRKIEPTVKPKIKAKGDSWWSIFSGIFKTKRKPQTNLKFAQIASAPTFAEAVVDKKAMAVKEEEPPKKEKSNGLSQPKDLAKSELSVNLIPQASRKDQDDRLVFEAWLFSASVLVAVFLVTVAYFSLVYLNDGLAKEMSEKQAEFSRLDSQVKSLANDEKNNNELADRINLIKKLFNNQIKWSNFFALMEKYTLNGVYFTQLSADTSGALVLPGMAENYTVLAKQLALFNDAEEFIKEAKLSEARIFSDDQAGITGVGFQVRLILQDSIFKK